MAQKKETAFWAVLWHGLIYAAGMTAVLVLGLSPHENVLPLVLAAGSLHLGIDLIKCLFVRWTADRSFSGIKERILTIDQCLHGLSLVAAWWFWGRGLPVRELISTPMTALPALPVNILLALLINLRPVGTFISRGEFWSGMKLQTSLPEPGVKNAGRTIGYLERMIILFFLLFQQYSAIAFVLTAKSVARFKEIESNQIRAEYYLIGTLLSVLCVFVTALLLGLCVVQA